MKIGCIIQARNTSKRLPMKVLKPLPLDSETSVLEHVIHRIKKVEMIDEIVVATTINDEDTPIFELASKLDVEVFRGSEDHVLSRFYYAATENQLDMIIRITSDCPCIDPQVIQDLINCHLESGNDYTNNTRERTFPHGLDAEIFTYVALEEAFLKAKDKFEIEHVTPYIYESNKEKFKIGALTNHRSPESASIRVTLDTAEDYMALAAVFDGMKENLFFALDDLIALYEKKPWLRLINGNIIQKKKYKDLRMEVADAIQILSRQELYNAAAILENAELPEVQE